MFFCHLFCFFVVVLSFLLHIFSLCSSAESIKRGTRETKKKQTLQTKKLELKNKTKDSPVKCEDQKKKKQYRNVWLSLFFYCCLCPSFRKVHFLFSLSLPHEMSVMERWYWSGTNQQEKRNETLWIPSLLFSSHSFVFDFLR